MRTICTILFTALVFYTVLFEESELIINKISLRCMFFVFAIFSIDLYLRGMGLVGLDAYIAAMIIILCTDDSKPNSAAYIILFYDTLAIIAFFRSYNPANHIRRFIPVNILDQLPGNGQQAPNPLQDSDSDSDEDEVIIHWPAGLEFLDDEEFILGDFQTNTAPAA